MHAFDYLVSSILWAALAACSITLLKFVVNPVVHLCFAFMLKQYDRTPFRRMQRAQLRLTEWISQLPSETSMPIQIHEEVLRIWLLGRSDVSPSEAEKIWNNGISEAALITSVGRGWRGEMPQEDLYD